MPADAVNRPDRAWDERMAPELDLIGDCVHCGFCLPTCPTYSLWGEEMDSPRGRIVLMRLGHEEGSEVTPTMVDHLDNCLGCMACVTACPSGVEYDKLIEDTRAQVERNHPRSPRERLLRRLLFETFPHPGRLRAAAPLLAAYRRSGLSRLVARKRLLDRFPTLRTFEQLAPDVGARSAVRRLPAVVPARGARRGRVGFLQGCVQRVFFQDANAATVAVLAAEGFEVHAPRLPRCCGALQLHAGEQEGARELAKATIAAFEGFDHVVVNAAGCGSAIKDYDHLLREQPSWRERAAELGARARDVSELLAEHEPRATRGPVRKRVAYHDACHLAHAQGVRSQPRELLRAHPGAGARRAPGVGDLLRLGRHLQPRQARGRRRAGTAQGRQPAGHGGGGDRGGEPGLRAPARGAPRAPGPAAARLPPGGALEDVDRRGRRWR